MEMKKVKIFEGTSGCQLAEKIAGRLGVELGKSKILNFKDGECYVKIDEKVRGEDVFVVQSTSTPVNENILGLLIFVDALKRASAKSINVITPYFGYSRQDRTATPREPITAKLVANLLTAAGATRLIGMDFHTYQLEGFFDIPVEHIEGMSIIVDELKANGYDKGDVVVVAPHTNALKKARKLAEELNCKISIVDERTKMDGEFESITLIGDVKDKTVILIDDMIVTGKKMITAADFVMAEGAKEVVACATHGILVGDAYDKLMESCLEKVFVTDSIRLDKSKKTGKMNVIPSDRLFSEVLKRIINNESITDLLN